jgi:PAS domain S-box-containing protein
VCQPECTVERAGLLEVVEQVADGIVITDTSGKIEYVNPAFTALTGYSSEEAVGQNPRLLKSGRNSAALYEELWRTILSGKVWHGEVINRRKDGTFYDEEMRIAPIQDSNGATTGYVVIKHDVTKQRAAQGAQAFLAAIVESSEDVILAYTPAGTILTWNRGAEVVFGYSAEEAIGKPLAMLVAAERLPFLPQFNERLLQGSTVSQLETLCARKGGQTFHASVTGSSIGNSAGEVTAISLIVRDTSERWNSEQRLRISEERFREVFEYAPVGICVAGPDERFIQVNAALCKLSGYSEQELLGKTWLELCHPDDLAATVQRKEQLWNGRDGIAEGERRYIHRNGRVIWCHVRISLLRTDDGSPRYSVMHVEDITERKRAEVSLRESEERFRTMADSSPSMMWVTSAEGKVEFVNRVLREFCGIGCEEVSGRNWQMPIHPDDAPACQSAFQRALSEHTEFSVEARARRADGQWRLLGSKGVPRLSEGGEYMGHVGLASDITDRKRAERKLRESEERFRAVFEHAPYGMCVTGMDGRYTQVNVAFCRMMGYSEQELLGKPWSDLTHPDDMESSLRTEGKISKNLGGWEEAEKRYIHRNGTVVWVHIKIAVVLDSDGAPLCHVVHVEDITGRRLAEEALRESEERFRIMADTCPIGIWVTDTQGGTRFVNSTYREFSGRTSEQVRAHEWKMLLHPEDDVKFVKAFACALSDHTPFKAEHHSRRADGEWRWVESHAVPRFSPDGEFLGLVGTSTDITDRKLLHQQLLQAQKLESVGQLAAGIAHEINTPTQYIGDNVRFLKDAFQDLSGLLTSYERLLPAAKDNTLARENVREVEEAVERADAGYLLEEIPKAIDQALEGVTRVSKIVGAMREFSHPGSKEKSPLNLNHAIENTITVSRNEWKYVAGLETDFDPSLPLVSCLLGEFNQVILNLIVNAAQAIGDVVKKGGLEKGRITVQTRSCPQWAEIRIQDTGTGISEKARSRIFDPFFTTKEIGKGTGQGLAIARSVIVDKHGGSIHFETEEGKGTTFIVRIPYDGKALAREVVVA